LNFKINVGCRIHWCASSAQKDNLSTNKLSKSNQLVVGQATNNGSVTNNGKGNLVRLKRTLKFCDKK
jgi:hypothetical protein